MNFELIALDLYKKIDIIDKNYNNLEINFKKVVEENRILKNDNIIIKEDIKTLKSENKNLREESKIMKDEIKTLKEEMKNIKEESKNVKEKNKLISEDNNNKNIINYFENLNNSTKKNINYFYEKNNIINNNIIIKSFDSAIIEKNEFNMIYSAIKERMNREIKELKKIYQATVDGGDSDIFHKKCDNISNTIVLYKTTGNRRFGGFTSQSWKTGKNSLPDEKCFLFSLDKKKIYFPKKDCFNIVRQSFSGTSFSISGKYVIQTYKNALKEKFLYTNEKKFSYIFDGDIDALSEDGEYKGVYAQEYEVFQIIFN